MPMEFPCGITVILLVVIQWGDAHLIRKNTIDLPEFQSKHRLRQIAGIVIYNNI